MRKGKCGVVFQREREREQRNLYTKSDREAEEINRETEG